MRDKGGHIRTIPVPEWVKAAVDRWTLAASINAGPLLRSINKAGKIWGDGFTPKVIWAIVKANAKSCGLPTVAPHDLRRYAESRTMPSRCAVCGIDVVPVHDCAIRLAANWNRFNFCWVTSPSKRRNATSGASSVSVMRSTITLVWNQMRHLDRRLRKL